MFSLFKKRKLPMPPQEENWKKEEKEYLTELQRFLDKADNIQSNDLRQEIINQMLHCDKILTEICEKKFIEYYNMGYTEAKKV